MAILKRGTKIRREKRRPEAVTGNFELHYEDVVNRNRFTLVALFASGLVLLAVVVPSAVYQSVADTGRVSVEAESGVLINSDLVTKVENDVTASGNSYLEFQLRR